MYCSDFRMPSFTGKPISICKCGTGGRGGPHPRMHCTALHCIRRLWVQAIHDGLNKATPRRLIWPKGAEKLQTPWSRSRAGSKIKGLSRSRAMLMAEQVGQAALGRCYKEGCLHRNKSAEAMPNPPEKQSA